MKKRLLSALLSLGMVLTMVPMAFAAEDESNGNSDISAQAATELPEVVNGVITLQQDVTLNNTLTVEDNDDITLNLNGRTLTLNGLEAVQDVAYDEADISNSVAGIINKGTLTVQNGTLSSTANACMIINSGNLSLEADVDLKKSGAGNAIDNLGGTVTSAADITLTNTDYTAFVTYGGVLTVNGGNIQADYGISAFNRSYNNESAGAQVKINGGSIKTDYFALSTNNVLSGGNDPCDVTINGGTLTSTGATAIYWPSAGSLTIGSTDTNDNTVIISTEAGSAIEVCSGTLVVNSGTLSGSDSSNSLNQSPTWATQYRENSGCAGLGDAITIIARRGAGYDTAALNVTINGGTFSSSDNYAVRYFDCNEVSGAAQIVQDVSVSITGGSFTETGEGESVDAAIVSETNQKFITGGTFSSNVSDYVATGYTCTQDVNNFVVKEAENGAMEVTTEGDGSVTLDGIYKGTNTEIKDETSGATSDDDTSSGVDENGAVNVDLTTDSETANSATLNVTQNAAASLSAAPSLTVQTDVGSVTLNDTALDEVGEAGSEVMLTITKDTDTASNEVAAYTVTLTDGEGNNLLPYGQNAGSVTITVPKAENAIAVWYVTGDKDNRVYVEKLQDIDSSITTGQNITYTINHLSTTVQTNSIPTNTAKVMVTNGTAEPAAYTTLGEAVENAAADSTITLQDNVTLTNSINIQKSLTLDLNGYTVTGLDDAYSLRIHGSSVSVTIKDSSETGNGKITSSRNDNGGIVQVADAATLTLESGTIEATGANGGCPVLVMGMGAISGDSEDATFNMTGGTLKANGYFALAGNGTWDGTTINISGGTITSAKSAGIYHPQEGTLTLTGGTISGTTAVQICAGTLSIPSNSKVTITATGEDNREGKTGDGLIDDGSAVSVVNRAGYGDVPKVTIAGGTFVSENETPVLSYAWKDDGVDNDGTRVKGFVSGGSFSDSVSEYVNNTLRAELVKSSGNAPYSYYQNVATALNAAQPGDKINQLTAVGEDDTCTVTLDYNDNSSGDTVLKVVKNTSITLPSPTRSGYTFRYWSDGSETYSARMNVTINDDITFTAVWRSNSSSSGSSSGGGSSSSNRYTVSVDSGIDNGSISVSPSRAERGDTVTITVDPDEGYELENLTVTDKNGDKISVTDKGNGKYTFTMPSGKVTIDATFTEVAETPDQVGSFVDVSTGDWFADAVQYMLDNGMMNGVTDTMFAPNTTTTRGMIVTILYRLEGEPDAAASSFTDVAANMYYEDAVAWAQANDIVNGISATLFAPDQSITREQMAAILYRYAQFKDYDVTASNDLSSYTDASQISAYATTAMQWANAEGLITGNTSTTINPTGNATRAEVATILMRFCENITP